MIDPAGLRRAAVGLALLGAAAAAIGITWRVRGLEAALPEGLEPGPSAVWFIAPLAFIAAGLVVARRQPGNAVGWILLGIGDSWALHGAAGVLREQVAVASSTGTLPGHAMPWLAWWWDVAWIPGVALVPLLVLLFPDGRLPTSRWRWHVRATGIATLLLLASLALRPGPFTNTGVDNPLGVDVLEAAVGPLEAVAGVLLAAVTVASVVATVLRYRRGSTVQRHQLKWFLAAATLVLVAWIAADGLAATGAAPAVVGNIRVLVLVALPVATVIAVLRHRLYDIDLVLSRGLVYGGLAVAIGLVYVGVVFGVGTLVGARATDLPLTVAATAVAAVLFHPLRLRLQRMANRLVFGQQASPYDVLSSFTQRISGTYPLGEAPHSIAVGIAGALHPAGCDVWLREGDQLHRVATWPEPGNAAPPVPVARIDEGLPGAAHEYLIHHDGEVRGALGVSLPAGHELTPGQQRLLSELAAAACPVLDNDQLVRELRSSRQRLVSAGDAHRRRMERDLHDGAQQRMLELAMTLQMARQRASTEGPAATVDLIAAAEQQVRTALAELRDLARGIHPAILTERGLLPALESLADRAPIPVLIHGSEFRSTPVLEATAYFVVAEALTNVIKHSGAATAEVALGVESDVLSVEVRDDGIGGADRSGAGLLGLTDRVAAVGGRLLVHSPNGCGTRIRAELPCE
ncbi:GAF domain-containing sensor histidine kinase [Nocardioides limicola]|uniref:GAF domain-containing sensor histidine kinase n=1 Tax=Nocardioides limicola TaxID=2803368 RepID=UPI00193BB9B0|nr:sensor histidine kinase [Nocardioides sp. DJM-14]